MENLNLIDLTNLIEAVLGILFLIAMKYLLPWLKARMTAEQEASFALIVEIAVMAAEKIYGAQHGEDKLKYVEEYLEARGIYIDTTRIRAYVNSAIKKMEQSENGGITIVENITGAVVPEEEDEEPQEG